MVTLLYSSIMTIAGKHIEAARNIIYCRSPDEVRTAVKLGRNALVLAPIAPLSNIRANDVANAWSLGKHTVWDQEVNFSVIPLAKPPIKEHGLKGTYLAARWRVATTDDESKANMELKPMGPYHVPCLINRRVLQPHAKLWRFKARDVVAPLSNVLKVEGAKRQKKR